MGKSEAYSYVEHLAWSEANGVERGERRYGGRGRYVRLCFHFHYRHPLAPARLSLCPQRQSGRKGSGVSNNSSVGMSLKHHCHTQNVQFVGS